MGFICWQTQRATVHAHCFNYLPVPAGTPLNNSLTFIPYSHSIPSTKATCRVTPLQFYSPWNRGWHCRNNRLRRRVLWLCEVASHAVKLCTAQNSTEPKLWAIRARERQRVIQKRSFAHSNVCHHLNSMLLFSSLLFRVSKAPHKPMLTKTVTTRCICVWLMHSVRWKCVIMHTNSLLNSVALFPSFYKVNPYINRLNRIWMCLLF